MLLEKHGANPNTIIPNLHIAPIHYAVGFDNIEFAEKVTALFVRKGGDPNLLSEGDRLTPLHIACIWDRSHIVHLLLQNGGNLDVKCQENQTPIMYAVHEGNFRTIETIQEFVFERKIEKKKNELILKSRGQDSSTSSKHSEESYSTPIRNNHLKNALQNLEEKKFTPNRINYNFDATSPYYINITHRRHKSSREKSRALFDDEGLDTENVNENHSTANHPNLFDLTEKNLKNFSSKMTDVIVVDRLAIHKRKSYIKDWREKIQEIRKSDKKLDIGYINYLNECNDVTLMTSDDSEKDEKSSSDSFITAKSDLDRSKHAIKLLPEPKIIEHLEEDYIHSDGETGIVLYEKKIISKSRMDLRDIETEDNDDEAQSSISTKVTIPPLDYDTDNLRAELTNLTGANPGPITQGTKRLYLKQLVKLQRRPMIVKDNRVQACKFNIF